MPLTIRVSEHSQSTGSDHTHSAEHTDDDEYHSGVPVASDSHSNGSQVDSFDEDDVEDEFVRVRYRHVRRVAHPPEVDDIEPSDSASRPGTSRQSSTNRALGESSGRGQSRRRQPVPEAPPNPRPARRPSAPAPRELPHGRGPRPESFHSDSLDHDDYPYGPGGGLPFRPHRPGTEWSGIPRYPPYEPTSLSTRDHPFQDVMQYRDPYYDERNPFAPNVPSAAFDDYYDPIPPPRSRPQRPARHSMGPFPHALMPYRDPYGYDPYRDAYGYGRRPPPPDMRPVSPEKAAEHHSKPPTPAVPPAPSPGDERLAKLELLIMQQTEDNRKRAAAKETLRKEEEMKKKAQEEKTQSEKLIALEKLLLKQNEDAISREKKMEEKAKQAEASATARYAKEAAEKAAKDKIAKELADAAGAAKKAAEDDAAKKAKEAKDKADKELAEMKQKHEEAEAAKKKAEAEAEKLKPKGVPPPIRFKDAVGRKFQFPFDICKTWKGMEGLIRQAFMHVDLLGPHVQEGHYDLIGPDGEIILPQVWETMIKPDYAIDMQMWPIPELEKGKLPGGPGAMPDLDVLLKGLGAPTGKPGKHGHAVRKGKKGAAVPLAPPPPPLPFGGVIPAPPTGPFGSGPAPMGPGGGGPNLAALFAASGGGGGGDKKKKKKDDMGAVMRWVAGPGRKSRR